MSNENRVAHSCLAKFLALFVLVFVVLIAKRISRLETNEEILKDRLKELDPKLTVSDTSNILENDKINEDVSCECTNEEKQLSQEKQFEHQKRCFPRILKDYSKLFIFNILLICTIGGVGNIITLLSVPYVYYRYPKQFQLQWNSVTLLMLHLSVLDLLYVCLCLPPFILIYSTGYFPYPQWMCWLTAAIRNLIAYADFLTLACIALLRMRGICKNKNTPVRSGSDESTFKTFSYIICIWSVSFLIISPILFELVIFEVDFGGFGYNPMFGMCNTVSCPEGGFSPSGMIYTVGFFGPFFAINISYIIIAILYIDADKESVLQRDQQQVDLVQLTRTLILLSGSYMAFCGPLLPLEWSETWGITKELNVMLYVVGYNWYWWAYANNFIVYMLSSEAFRNIFKIFLHDVWTGLKACFKADSETKAPTNSDLEPDLEPDLKPDNAQAHPRQIAVIQNHFVLNRAYTVDCSEFKRNKFGSRSTRPALRRSHSMFCQPQDVRPAGSLCVSRDDSLAAAAALCASRSAIGNQSNAVELQELSAWVLVQENPPILTQENHQMSSSVQSAAECSQDSRKNFQEDIDNSRDESLKSWILGKLIFRRGSYTLDK